MAQFPQADEHVRNVDPHRASALTGAAQRGRMRQMRVVSDTIKKRGQNAADRSRIDAAVSVASDPPVNRAGVQTSAAADTLQALAKRRSENFRAAIVQNNEMKFLRPIDLTFPARPGDQCGVHRKRLSRSS